MHDGKTLFIANVGLSFGAIGFIVLPGANDSWNISG
jgi:hypothetical protein